MRRWASSCFEHGDRVYLYTVPGRRGTVTGVDSTWVTVRWDGCSLGPLLNYFPEDLRKITALEQLAEIA